MSKIKKLPPITAKYFWKYQIDQYKQVKKKHGKKYADKWFKAKFL